MLKIVEETRTRLVIKHHPLTMWFNGGMLVALGCGFLIHNIIFESASLRFSCTRNIINNQMNCELRTATSVGIVKKVKLFDIHQAYVQTIRGSKGGNSYKVIIVNDLGEHSLLRYLGYEENQRAATKINHFITSGETYLSLEQNQRRYLFLFNSFIFIFLLFAIYMATTPLTICTFYKSLNKVIIERKGLRSRENIEYPLEQVFYIEIQEKRVKWQKQYRPAIIFKTSETIPISLEYSYNYNNVSDAVDRIKLFLNS
jgi:hypothetical protein